MTERCLVTGGAGFIGSHLVGRLLDAGRDVVVLDDESTGRRGNLPAAHPRLRFVSGSVTDAALVDRLMADGVQLVFHLAAVVGVDLVVERPLRAVHVNVRGTEVVLQAAARHGARCVVASSSEVYGDEAQVPFDDRRPLAPGAATGPVGTVRSGYARAKAWCERAALDSMAASGVGTLVVRLFNTVGPRQRGCYGMVLPRFVDAGLAGAPIEVFGDGRQTRCFAHVTDVVESILRLTEAGAWGGIFNVGNDAEISIRQLAELVVASTGGRSEIVHRAADPRRAPDVRRRVPSLRSLESAVGYRPSTAIEQIVADVIAAKAASRAASRRSAV